MSSSGGRPTLAGGANVLGSVITGGGLVLQSLSGVSATGPGTAYTNEASRARANPTMVVVTSAGVTAGAVQLQGSLDGVNWFNIGTAISTTTASAVLALAAAPGTTHIALRANVTTPIAGGTISAWVASA